MSSTEIVMLVLVIVLAVALVAIAAIALLKRKKDKSNEGKAEGDAGAELDQITRSLDDLSSKVSRLESVQDTHQNTIQNRMTSFSESISQMSGKQQTSMESLASNLPTVIDSSVQKSTIAAQTDLNNSLSQSIDNRFKLVEEQLQKKVKELENSIESRLRISFEQNNTTLGDVKESLGKVTEAQKNLDSLSAEVTNLNSILSNSRERGRFGELSMEAILNQVFGDTHDVYLLQSQIQDSLWKGTVKPDAIVKLPAPANQVCIDSKFSFAAYDNLLRGKESDAEAKREMANALRKQIDDIASKYIVDGVTADYAIMYIPSDGIYSFIQSDGYLYEKVVEYSRTKKVIIASPSTLQPILANISILWADYRRKTNLDDILKNIQILSKELSTLKDKWEKFSKDVDDIVKSRDSFNTTMNLVNNKALQIKNASASEEE